MQKVPSGRVSSFNQRGYLKYLCESLWRIERELDLFNRSIEGIFYWSLLRAFLAETIASRLGWCQPVPESVAQKVRRRLSPFLSDASALFTSASGSFDTILIRDRRKTLRDGQNAYIHSDAALSEPEFGRSMVLLPSEFQGKIHNGPNYIVRGIGGLGGLARIRGLAKCERYLSQAQTEHASLSTEVHREIGIDLPISAIELARIVAIFQEKRHLARKLLKASGARRLLLVDATTRPEFVAAAQDVGLYTCDLQHGLVTKYQMTYSFPGRPFVPYTSDLLLTFGSFWNDGVDLARNLEPRVIGSDNMARHRANNHLKVRRRVIVVSQPEIGGGLFDAIVVAARAATEWTFIFRPHPREIPDAYLQRLRDIASPPTNLLVSSFEEEFYPLLCSAEVQIGVSSTALFEGMALGVRTIVLTLFSVERMEAAILQGDATVAEFPEEIWALLETAPKARQSEKYYAAPVASMAAVIAR